MKILNIISIVCVFLFFTSCNKSDKNLYYKGNIVGFIHLVDESGNEVNDKSGVTVTLDNTPYSSISDEIGRYELVGVKAGTYNVYFSKEGYGTMKQSGYSFIGGNIPAYVGKTSLYQMPTIVVKSIDVKLEDNMIKISGEITETSQYRFQIFFNDSSNVSCYNYDYKTSDMAYNFYGPETSFSYFVHLDRLPYSKGNKIYLVIYFMNYYQEYGYYDYNTGRYIDPTYKKVTDAIPITIE
jgi:hypothetical protein